MRLLHRSVLLLLLTALLLGSSGVVAAQDGSNSGAQGEVSDSLTEIESFVATTLGQLGVIVLLVGSAVWFFSGKRSDRAAWGWRAIFGGAGMIILSVSYNVIVSLIKSFAPGMVWLPLF
jgi:hypothetical protein